MVTLAQEFAGVSVFNDRARYIQALGPDESPAMRDYFCSPKTSGCGLFVRGLWRLIGVDDPSVRPNYKFGTAISSLVGVARRRNAWIVARPGALPSPGDCVLVGGSPQTDGGVEHVFVVTRAPLTIADPIESVDGGQVDHGLQAIAPKVRRWTVRAGATWDVSRSGSDPGAGAPGGRRAQGWVDLEKLLSGQSAPKNLT